MIGAVNRMLATGFGIYLCVIGAAFAAIAVGLFVKRVRISAGPRADGQVIGYVSRMANRPSWQHYMPLVRFTPRGGTPVEFQSRMGADPARWPEGTPVPVAYREERPDHAEIATAARLWLAPPMLLLFAAASFAIAWKVGG
jgi:hypothetical protein